MRRTEVERLKEQVDQLDPQEQHQLFLVIRKYTSDFTQTESGVLVQSTALSDECLREMKTYVSFCQDQKKRMDEDTQARKAAERLMTN